MCALPPTLRSLSAPPLTRKPAERLENASALTAPTWPLAIPKQVPDAPQTRTVLSLPPDASSVRPSAQFTTVHEARYD
jgi:hypothetical protein